MLLRYSILHSDHSPVKLAKVTYGGEIRAGLEATRDIAAATYILSTCSSMSIDLYGQGFSIIRGDPQQNGPVGNRLILGPFRLANHDCQPNCQVRPIVFSVIHLWNCFRFEQSRVHMHSR